eukprot:jgi/Mesvir1/15893/Mv02797-RA.2
MCECATILTPVPPSPRAAGCGTSHAATGPHAVSQVRPRDHVSMSLHAGDGPGELAEGGKVVHAPTRVKAAPHWPPPYGSDPAMATQQGQGFHFPGPAPQGAGDSLADVTASGSQGDTPHLPVAASISIAPPGHVQGREGSAWGGPRAQAGDVGESLPALDAIRGAAIRQDMGAIMSGVRPDKVAGAQPPTGEPPAGTQSLDVNHRSMVEAGAAPSGAPPGPRVVGRQLARAGPNVRLLVNPLAGMRGGGPKRVQVAPPQDSTQHPSDDDEAMPRVHGKRAHGREVRGPTGEGRAGASAHDEPSGGPPHTRGHGREGLAGVGMTIGGRAGALASNDDDGGGALDDDGDLLGSSSGARAVTLAIHELRKSVDAKLDQLCLGMNRQGPCGDGGMTASTSLYANPQAPHEAPKYHAAPQQGQGEDSAILDSPRAARVWYKVGEPPPPWAVRPTSALDSSCPPAPFPAKPGGFQGAAYDAGQYTGDGTWQRGGTPWLAQGVQGAAAMGSAVRRMASDNVRAALGEVNYRGLMQEVANMQGAQVHLDDHLSDLDADARADAGGAPQEPALRTLEAWLDGGLLLNGDGDGDEGDPETFASRVRALVAARMAAGAREGYQPLPMAAAPRTHKGAAGAAAGDAMPLGAATATTAAAGPPAPEKRPRREEAVQASAGEAAGKGAAMEVDGGADANRWTRPAIAFGRQAPRPNTAGQKGRRAGGKPPRHPEAPAPTLAGSAAGKAPSLATSLRSLQRQRRGHRVPAGLWDQASGVGKGGLPPPHWLGDGGQPSTGTRGGVPKRTSARPVALTPGALSLWSRSGHHPLPAASMEEGLHGRTGRGRTGGGGAEPGLVAGWEQARPAQGQEWARDGERAAASQGSAAARLVDDAGTLHAANAGKGGGDALGASAAGPVMGAPLAAATSHALPREGGDRPTRVADDGGRISGDSEGERLRERALREVALTSSLLDWLPHHLLASLMAQTGPLGAPLAVPGGAMASGGDPLGGTDLAASLPATDVGAAIAAGIPGDATWRPALWQLAGEVLLEEVQALAANAAGAARPAGVGPVEAAGGVADRHGGSQGALPTRQYAPGSSHHGGAVASSAGAGGAAAALLAALDATIRNARRQEGAGAATHAAAAAAAGGAGDGAGTHKGGVLRGADSTFEEGLLDTVLSAMRDLGTSVRGEQAQGHGSSSSSIKRPSTAAAASTSGPPQAGSSADSGEDLGAGGSAAASITRPPRLDPDGSGYGRGARTDASRPGAPSPILPRTPSFSARGPGAPPPVLVSGDHPPPPPRAPGHGHDLGDEDAGGLLSPASSARQVAELSGVSYSMGPPPPLPPGVRPPPPPGDPDSVVGSFATSGIPRAPAHIQPPPPLPGRSSSFRAATPPPPLPALRAGVAPSDAPTAASAPQGSTPTAPGGMPPWAAHPAESHPHGVAPPPYMHPGTPAYAGAPGSSAPQPNPVGSSSSQPPSAPGTAPPFPPMAYPPFPYALPFVYPPYPYHVPHFSIYGAPGGGGGWDMPAGAGAALPRRPAYVSGQTQTDPTEHAARDAWTRADEPPSWSHPRPPSPSTPVPPSPPSPERGTASLRRLASVFDSPEDKLGGLGGLSRPLAAPSVVAGDSGGRSVPDMPALHPVDAQASLYHRAGASRAASASLVTVPARVDEGDRGWHSDREEGRQVDEVVPFASICDDGGDGGGHREDAGGAGGGDVWSDEDEEMRRRGTFRPPPPLMVWRPLPDGQDGEGGGTATGAGAASEVACAAELLRCSGSSGEVFPRISDIIATPTSSKAPSASEGEVVFPAGLSSHDGTSGDEDDDDDGGGGGRAPRRLHPVLGHRSRPFVPGDAPRTFSRKVQRGRRRGGSAGSTDASEGEVVLRDPRSHLLGGFALEHGRGAASLEACIVDDASDADGDELARRSDDEWGGADAVRRGPHTQGGGSGATADHDNAYEHARAAGLVGGSRLDRRAWGRGMRDGARRHAGARREAGGAGWGASKGMAGTGVPISGGGSPRGSSASSSVDAGEVLPASMLQAEVNRLRSEDGSRGAWGDGRDVPGVQGARYPPMEELMELAINVTRGHSGGAGGRRRGRGASRGSSVSDSISSVSSSELSEPAHLQPSVVRGLLEGGGEDEHGMASPHDGPPSPGEVTESGMALMRRLHAPYVTTPAT